MDLVVKSKVLGLILALCIIFFGLESSYSILLFLIVMLSIGIPHGSVDHIIAFINPKARKFDSKLIFYTTYLSLIIFNIIIWVLSPFLGLLVFLISPWTELFTFEYNVINMLICGWLSSGTSYVLCTVFGDEGINVKGN